MALADALHGLLRLPGATYSCVVERDSGRVLAEAGNGEAGAGDGEGVVPYSVARWGTAVAAMFEATSGDELDDVMITGRRSYHLLRALGPTSSVLVYLRLDRTRSNLAAARRELATVRWGESAPRSVTGPPTAAPADSRTDPPRDAGVPARGLRATASLRSVGGTGEARAARTSADDPPRSAPSAAPSAAPAASAAAARATRVPAALPPGGTPARGLPAAQSGNARADPARSGATRSGTTRSDAARGRATSGAADAGPAGSPGARSGPEDDRTTTPAAGADTTGPRPAAKPDRKPDQPARGPQIPLPRRSPGQRSPVTRASAQGGDTGSRRRGGARGPGGEPAVPDGFPVPAVLGQSWARDPSTLRRLIAGLRRMS
jgi:hypothetical protein